MSPKTGVKKIHVDGVEVFYREAGPKDAPTILLLHGFPSSSFQYRALIPLLAAKYHVLAPDLPGFGFTVVPESRKYNYTFDSFKTTVGAFVDALGVKKYVVYIFDYGAPIGLRLALERPESIIAIISQNGNAYKEGLGQPWDAVDVYWKEGTKETRVAVHFFTSFDGVKWGYIEGEAHPEIIPPETYHLDYFLVNRPGNAELQWDIFYDYRHNVELYPKFQEYFRTYQPPTLAVWGKGDKIFIPPGAEAFKKDNPKAVVKLIDAGHFALENHVDEIAGEIMTFLKQQGI